jgi:hypothetical protein
MVRTDIARLGLPLCGWDFVVETIILLWDCLFAIETAIGCMDVTVIVWLGVPFCG